MTLITTLIAALISTQAGPVLTLEDALRTANEHNPDLTAARAKLTQARELAHKAWSGYLPQLSASGNYMYNSSEARILFPTGYYVRDMGQPIGPPFDPTQEPSPDNPVGAPTPYVLYPSGLLDMEIQKQHQLSATFQLTQAVLVPTLWSQIRAAYLAGDIAELSVESARREILFAVIQLYYGAEGLREAVEVQERLLEVNRQHERDAELGVQAGTAPRMALLRAQIERIRSEQDVLRTRNAYESSVSALAALLDRAPDFQVTRPESPVALEDMTSLEDQALAHRPDVLAARENLVLAEVGRHGVVMRYAPVLAVFARYNLSNAAGFTGDYGQFNAGATLSWTLWDGGLRESDLRDASTKIAESRANLRAAENKAKDEVRRALLDLQSAEANRIKAEEQVRMARENSQLARLSFEAGTATSLEAVDASAALRGAELTLISEQLNAQLALIRLAKVAGLFNPLAPTQPAAKTEKP